MEVSVDALELSVDALEVFDLRLSDLRLIKKSLTAVDLAFAPALSNYQPS